MANAHNYQMAKPLTAWDEKLCAEQITVCCTMYNVCALQFGELLFGSGSAAAETLADDVGDGLHGLHVQRRRARLSVSLSTRLCASHVSAGAGISSFERVGTGTGGGGAQLERGELRAQELCDALDRRLQRAADERTLARRLLLCCTRRDERR